MTNTDTAHDSVVEKWVLEWEAAPRPPIHPKPMIGRQGFRTLEDATARWANLPDDAKLVSLRLETTLTTDETHRIDAALATTTQPDTDSDPQRIAETAREITRRKTATLRRVVENRRTQPDTDPWEGNPAREGMSDDWGTLAGPHPLSKMWAEAFHAWEEHGHWQACDILAKHFARIDRNQPSVDDVIEQCAKVASDAYMKAGNPDFVPACRFISAQLRALAEGAGK